VGRGLTCEHDRQLARKLGLDHVSFIDFVPYAELVTHMARADVCLGIFGDNARADLVLTNKAIEAIGMGKPLITRRNDPVSPAVGVQSSGPNAHRPVSPFSWTN